MNPSGIGQSLYKQQGGNSYPGGLVLNWNIPDQLYFVLCPANNDFCFAKLTIDGWTGTMGMIPVLTHTKTVPTDPHVR